MSVSRSWKEAEISAIEEKKEHITPESLYTYLDANDYDKVLFVIKYHEINDPHLLSFIMYRAFKAKYINVFCCLIKEYTSSIDLFTILNHGDYNSYMWRAAEKGFIGPILYLYPLVQITPLYWHQHPFYYLLVNGHVDAATKFHEKFKENYGHILGNCISLPLISVLFLEEQNIPFDRDSTAFTSAEDGRIDTIEYLISKGVSNYTSIALQAAGYKRKEIVDLMVEKYGVNLDDVYANIDSFDDEDTIWFRETYGYN